jgi:hypothetical protein
LLVKWADDSDPTWEHFYWVQHDDDDPETGTYFYVFRDFVAASFYAEEVPRWSSDNFTILYFADLPTIARVIDLTERLKNDIEEGASCP